MIEITEDELFAEIGRLHVERTKLYASLKVARDELMKEPGKPLLQAFGDGGIVDDGKSTPLHPVEGESEPSTA